jgi:hypothetical protein
MGVDVARVSEQLNAFWDSYGPPVILGSALLGLALVIAGGVALVRSRQRDRWVAGLTALVVLAWTSQGLWEVAYLTLGLPLAFSIMTFFVYEAMMLTSALQAEQHRRRRGTPGPAGRYVWVLATITASIVALNAATPVEALLRFTLPLAAAGLWWTSITAEPDREPAHVSARRRAQAARREATWAITPATMLVGLGLMRPGNQNMTQAERERRVRLMVVASDRLHTARPGSRRARRAAARLRRLARLASAGDVAEVRDRVERTTRITELVMPNRQLGPAAPVPTPGTGEQPDHTPARVKVPGTAWRVVQWLETWTRMCADPDLALGPIDDQHARTAYGASAKHLTNVRRAAVTGTLRHRAEKLGVPLPEGYMDDPAPVRSNGRVPAAA